MNSKEFDLADLDLVDEVDWDVTIDGKEIGWKWTFAGPGHQKTIDQGNRIAKEAIKRQAEQEQAQVNGRKWKPEDETPEDRRTKNISLVADRLIRWTDMKLGGEPFPFTVENARKILLDRRKPQLLQGALEFLGNEKSFTKRSPTTSEPTPSASSN
jgi:hypothetical protein